MEIIKRKGPFCLWDKQNTVIFTDEKQLDRIIKSPETPLFGDEERGFSYEKRGLYDENETSLMTLVHQAEEAGCIRMEASYDFFFGGTTRRNYPSSETTLRCFKVIHDVARQHGMTFGASILNPLDIGGGYIQDHDETGFTYQFCETEIHPDGSYSCPMLCQKQWNNNKGPIQLRLKKLLCFAFNEERIGSTPYFYVDPDGIVDISATASVDIHEDTYTVSNWGYGTCKMDFKGKWDKPVCDRALCVVVYQTPELDYFAPSALEYFKEVLDLHNSRGISYSAFYSDEMHIQFDWDQVAHFGEKEITTRYLTPNLIKEYARRYGQQYLDFARYLIYFSYHQHDFLPGEAGKENAQHVFGRTQKDIYDTWLFRNRYFELLQSRVVDLCCRAKEYGESLWGAPIMTTAHATWQEAPTCDKYYHTSNDIGGYDVEDQLEGFGDITKDSAPERRAAFELAKAKKAAELGVSRYDYTPWYDWSSSIRENTAACYDYFKWNDYLSGGNHDFPEGGNLDRNYYGHAMNGSLAGLNRFRLGYYGCWGMPDEVRKYIKDATDAFGSGDPYVSGFRMRVSDVLALYPIALNNVEERFGSWMVQYGYCNYITEEKFLQNAEVTDDGRIRVKENEYRALVVLFQPFLDPRTASMLRRFVEGGGKLLWMSIYPLLTPDGADASAAFRSLFGIRSIDNAYAPVKAKGKSVKFVGTFAGIADMPILNDYLVDYVYPFVPDEGTEVAAELDGAPAASVKRYPNGGLAVYAGFRVRDDQSCSLGKDVDTLYRILMKMGAYREGSLEARSREPGQRYITMLFPNGAISAAPHYREIYESWEGPFFREPETDALILKERSLPGHAVELDGKLLDKQVKFSGEGSLLFHEVNGELLGYKGSGASEITINGVRHVFSDRPCSLRFAFLPDEFLADGVHALMMVSCGTEGAELRIPVCGRTAPRAEVCSKNVYQTEGAVPFTMEDGAVCIRVTSELADKEIALIW